MNAEVFFPEDAWMGSAKDLIKIPAILLLFGATGPFVLFLPYIFWAKLIKYLLNRQKYKKINAILNTYSGKYTENDLLNLHKNDRKEFNRLYKLASDEFFREYIKEQADHKKAQEIIKILQTRIEGMRKRLKILEEKGKKYKEDIEILKEEINLYETIFSNWKQGAEQYG